jgi:hypothetical protein
VGICFSRLIDPGPGFVGWIGGGLCSLRWGTCLLAIDRTVPSITFVRQLFPTLDEVAVERARREKSALRLRSGENTVATSFSVRILPAEKQHELNEANASSLPMRDFAVEQRRHFPGTAAPLPRTLSTLANPHTDAEACGKSEPICCNPICRLHERFGIHRTL